MAFIKTGFRKGINLGGWMSQCDYSEERLNSFIKENDFAVIASWGFDHVRLPVDYNVLCKEDGMSDEAGLQRIENAWAWCEKNDLNMVIDLHKTPGFSFDQKEGESGFFENEKYQERFFRIWEALAERFGKEKGIAFELLNDQEKFNLPFTLLSDTEKTVIQAYDVWKEKNMYGKKTFGVVRTTYLIDENGIIVKAFSNVKAAENPQQMLNEI